MISLLIGGLDNRVNRPLRRDLRMAAGKPRGRIRPDTNTSVSSTARSLPAMPGLRDCRQDIRPQLLRPDLPVLAPYFLYSVPGVVIPQGLSRHDRFQTEFVDGASAFKGFAGQFPVDLGWNTDKDPTGIIPHDHHSFVHDDRILSC